MTTYQLAPLKLAAARFTKLDSCGVPDTGSCATFSTVNMVSVDQTGEATDATEFPLVNADGDLVEYTTDAARLKYLNLDIMVLKAVPEFVNWMTGDTLIQNDAASPSNIGWATETNGAASANFAMEGWVRLSGASACSGSETYGYVLFPWLYNGTFYEIKHENALSDLKITAKTHTGSPWGTGLYSVNLSDAAATLDEPTGLFTAVTSTQHKIFQVTRLPYPVASTDCAAVAGTIAVVDDDGAGAGLDATATIPTPLADTTPGVIDWGDTNTDVVASGSATAVHTYGAAGPYTVTYRPSAHSDRIYTGSVTMA